MTTLNSREPIFGLDLIRFASALLVLAWHLAYRFFTPGADHIGAFVRGVPHAFYPIHDIARWGWVGVQVFFVISGLVIAFSAQGASAWRFFVGRAARLWPAAFICTMLIFAIDVLFWQLDLYPVIKQVIKSLIFWPLGGWIAPQFWTLGVEVVFYSLVWLLIVSGKIRHIDRLAMGLALLSSVFWIAHLSGLTFGNWLINSLLMMKHGIYFAMGICLASIDREGLNWMRVSVIALALVVAPIEIAAAKATYGVPGADWWQVLLIWLLSVMAIAASLRWKASISRFVERMRLGKTLRVLGLATYPLYLIHIHMGGLVATLAIEQGVPPMPAVLLGSIVCVIVSILIAIWLEAPLRKVVVGIMEAGKQKALLVQSA